jgi:ABC-2 type transport system permease protein
VVDPTGYLKANLENSKVVSYTFAADVDTSNFAEKGYSAILLAPKAGGNPTDNFKLVTERSMNRFANERIERDISRSMEANLISEELKIDPKRIDSLKQRADAITVESQKRGEGGKLARSSFGVANGIGYATGFLIYFTLFIYGTMVMRGVMEEKTNRIAEVIISSVRPFQLMMGKIIGIGAVGLTQFIIWIILLAGISAILTGLVSPEVLEQAQQNGQQLPGSAQAKFGSPPQHCFGTSQPVYHQLGFGYFLLCIFLSWRLSFLCVSFCSPGQRCKRRPAGCAEPDAADHHANCAGHCYYDKCH